ncbi:unnamed protein product [Cuscuta epithymum]|uniref:Reverse transcriptase domain-containing protein n=1 Tax=Cuscuta epithymum TaxID=186058 RepID=A0AAV0C484_9ASTE|nr:unnamed protein product [Cuscuta epithymum]
MSAFKSMCLLEKINNTNIVLIPKERPEVLGDWWPISLCNVIYNCFVKVLPNRIKGLLHECIWEGQSAFVHNRSIIDNILIASESHQFLKEKMQDKMGYVG